MKKITIHNLEEKTAQEVFDFVAKHLLTQKKKSQRNAIGSKDCMYKSPEGLTCAVGCLIPKKDYTYDIEYRGVEDMLEYYDVVSKHEMLLTHLQLVHDTEEVENWQEALNIKAEKFKLKNYTLKIKKKKQ